MCGERTSGLTRRDIHHLCFIQQAIADAILLNSSDLGGVERLTLEFFTHDEGVEKLCCAYFLAG